MELINSLRYFYIRDIRGQTLVAEKALHFETMIIQIPINAKDIFYDYYEAFILNQEIRWYMYYQGLL